MPSADLPLYMRRGGGGLVRDPRTRLSSDRGSNPSTDVRDVGSTVRHRILLNDGERLDRLMIYHVLGVRSRSALVTRPVEEEGFSTT